MLEDSSVLHLVSRYGYLALTLGAMLEGETIVLIGGFLAHQGYLDLPWVMLCAFLGSSLSDQGLFFLSRIKGPALLKRFPRIQGRLEKLSAKTSARPHALEAFAFLFRFIYGIRNVAPVFLGLSRIKSARYVALNVGGAALWAVCVSSLGYVFARALDHFMSRLARYEVRILIGLLMLAAGVALFRIVRARRVRRAGRSGQAIEAGQVNREGQVNRAGQSEKIPAKPDSPE